MKIRLNDSTDATEIVSIANRFKNCDIDAQFGRYVIDLKSILESYLLDYQKILT